MIKLSTRPAHDVAEQQWATISFMPDDLVWFDWVIRQLEGYPVPSGLAGAGTRYGFPLPAKLTLFPDRWNPLNFEGYPTALETSRFLIVIVSPNSAQSSWVDDQILDFKRAGGEERIIALVVDAKPDALAGLDDNTWLPKWLAGRLGEKGFAPADAAEPVVIDGRGGGKKIEHARESLLASLLTTTCQELERMGGLTPPLDLTRFTAPAPAEVTRPEVPAPAAGKPGARFPKLTPTVGFAASAAGLAVFAGGWFLGRSTKHEAVPAPAHSVEVRNITAKPVVEVPPPKAGEPAATPATDRASAPEPTIVEPPKPPEAPPEVQPLSIGLSSEQIAANEEAEREKARREQNRREEEALRAEWLSQIAAGDSAQRHGSMLQATDFYSAAIATAERYAVRRSDDAATLAEMAVLCRRLGAMQVQVASIAEARASYERGRRILLKLKGRGQLTASRGQCLQDLETGIETLPRD